MTPRVDQKNVNLCGSSAGGHLALRAGMKREHPRVSAGHEIPPHLDARHPRVCKGKVRVLDRDDLVIDVLNGVAHASIGSGFFLKEHVDPIFGFFE